MVSYRITLQALVRAMLELWPLDSLLAQARPRSISEKKGQIRIL